MDKIQRYGVKTLTDLRNDYKSRADDVRGSSRHCIGSWHMYKKCVSFTRIWLFSPHGSL